MARAPRHRKFYELPPAAAPEGADGLAEAGEGEGAAGLAEYIRNSVIGVDATFLSPFGRRRVVYCDYTASGRSLGFIEDFIRAEVLPLYGNTHTTTSVTALQSTLYRHEARDLARAATGAGERDAVIFTGSGTTAAVATLASALGLRGEVKATVLVGPFEHHSNLLPWREAGAEVVAVRADPATGRTDLAHLARELERLQGRPGDLIGCFSAASNVTGVLEDDLAVTALLHSHGALAFWDYAAAAPYVSVQMNPVVPEDPGGLCHKDALYFSPHKLVGGVQTPGLLVAKKFLFRNPAPRQPGGGTVFYVTESDHRYLQEPEVREEGGTPAIVESVRAGLVLKLKAAVGVEHIVARDTALRGEALAAWAGLQELQLLGPLASPALPVFSFLIRHPATGLFLHYNFVVALLNDLFGIQARGGCACAGPHMQRLLGLDPPLVRRYEALLVEDARLDRAGLRRGHAEHGQWEVLRPGATRLGIPWFADSEEVSFVLEAVALVATEGWRLLPLYRFNNETGEWRHSSNSVFKDRRWLGHVSFASGRMKYSAEAGPGEAGTPAEVLAAARAALASAPRLAARETIPDQTAAFPPEVAALRWFLTPSEAAACLAGSGPPPAVPPPFLPPRLPGTAGPCPGSLSGRPLLGPATVRLCSVRPGPRLHRAPAPGPRLQAPAPGPRLHGADTVSVKGGSSVTVLAGEPVDSQVTVNGADSQVTVNGFKSVISVSSIIGEESPEDVVTGDVAEGEITFEEEEINCDKAPEGEGEICDSGLCQPAGPRLEALPALAKARWRPPGKDIFKPFIEAVNQFSMIRNGDRLLVCLSGGKDSLSLLHTVRQYQFYARQQGVQFELGAVTVDPGSEAYDPRPLVPYLQQLGVPYFYERQDIMAQALESKCTSICAFCSRMKRGRIYACARREGYTVLALGQHLDDLAESFFMSVFHNGRLRTMKACYTCREGDLRIIRPLVYVREQVLRRFAETSKLPVIAENCPACFEAPKERQRVKQLLAQQELLFPRLYWNLKAALHPVMRIDRTGVESVVFGRAQPGGEEEEEDGL